MRVSQLHPVKKILVPTDFIEGAKGTLLFAASLAARIDSKILLYHAIHVPVLNPHEIAIAVSPEELERESFAHLEALREEVVAQTGFTQIELHAEGGMAVEQISSFTRHHEIDLVVMGTSGAHGVGGFLFGSNTAEVVEKCTCPVLTVPFGVEFEVPDKILFATNYADNDFQSIYLLTQYFKVFRPEIVIAHVEARGNHTVEEGLMEWFKKQVHTNIPYDRIRFVLLKGNDIEDALKKHKEEEGYKLISTSMRSRNFFDHLTSRSLTRKMVNHSSIPLLAFHAYQSSGTPVF